MEQFAAYWEGLEDPRTGNAGLHDFHELLMIAWCTVLCGGQGAVDMALFAKGKKPFLRGFPKLKKGLPSHDTPSRLFRHRDHRCNGLSAQHRLKDRGEEGRLRPRAERQPRLAAR